MPDDGQLTDLGAWLRGVQGYGSIDVALVVWAWDGSTGGTNAILGRTNTRTISAASFALGSLQKQTWPLQAPVKLAAGAQFLVGFASDTDAGMACQWGVDAAGTKYAKDLGPPAGASWPVKMQNCYSDQYALSAWVENYDAASAAWVYRSGAWVQAQSVQVYRGGAWVDVGGVQVFRSGGWTDAG